MICKECEKKPIAKGIKTIKCKWCGRETLTNVVNKDICQVCSEKLSICERCGEQN